MWLTPGPYLAPEIIEKLEPEKTKEKKEIFLPCWVANGGCPYEEWSAHCTDCPKYQREAKLIQFKTDEREKMAEVDKMIQESMFKKSHIDDLQKSLNEVQEKVEKAHASLMAARGNIDAIQSKIDAYKKKRHI